jgi:2,3-bisphosphoglycerate-independent phosphoglycerate mutase
MSNRQGSRPVVLVILDGWGIGRDEPGNAVLAARTPTMDRLLDTYPSSTLLCSGEHVGLPAGLMGNSEVGHTNLGAGFIVYQSIVRIDRAIADGDFARNDALLGAIDRTRSGDHALHLIGLVSDGGVHSHIRHLDALLALAAEREASRVVVHAITDGRDTLPTSGAGFLADVERGMARSGVGRIETVMGRYYAMDRDHRWERTKRAYDAIVHGTGERADSVAAVTEASYAADVTDEFIVPTIIPKAEGGVDPIADEDSVILFNFRADRARQLTRAVVMDRFDGFDRGERPSGLRVATMTSYEDDFPVAVAFPPRDVENPVARVVSDAGLTQFHTAETEKYAHVTFFFNGGREEPFPGEERYLVPSPKVATYDLQPEMSAAGVTDGVVAAVENGTYDFVIVNFANCDMVGHTGSFDAAVSAVETADSSLNRIVDAVLAVGGVALVTADHGNAEEMIDKGSGGPMTAHTTNPVPVVLVAPDNHPLRHATLRQHGVLGAVGTTVIDLLGLTPPPEMDQPSLIEDAPA